MDKPFRKIYYVEGTREQIWDAFLTEKLIEKWLASTSEMDDLIGYEFYWRVNGERMEGKVIKLVSPFKEIVFEWRREEWDEGHFAKVHLEMNEMSNQTRLEIRIAHIPDGEWDEVYEDWDDTIIPKLVKYLKKINKK